MAELPENWMDQIVEQLLLELQPLSHMELLRRFLLTYNRRPRSPENHEAVLEEFLERIRATLAQQ